MLRVLLVTWTCYARPVALGGKTCGHVNAHGIRDRVAGQCCEACGCGKSASDARAPGFDVGTRVTVAISDPATWALGAAASLNGLAGAVVEIKTEHDAGLVRHAVPPRLLVELDVEPAPWNPCQPGRRWWFSAHELTR